MEQENFCKDCHFRHDCQEVYKKLGKSECPPVLFKTIAAFLVPMLVFTVSLAVFVNIFSLGSFSYYSKRTQSVFGLLAALLVTAICMLIEIGK